MKRLIIYFVAFLLFIPIISFYANAENWQQWRVPYFNGSTSERNLPINWSKTENVAWVVSMPSTGPFTPIIFKDKVFVTAVEEGTNKLLAICLDRISG